MQISKLLLLKTCLIVVVFLTDVVYAQQSVNGAGGEASGSGGTLSYSLGQVSYRTYSNGSSSIAQGVQQIYEVSTLSTTPTDTEFNLDLKAFPNPTTHTITLEVGDKKNQNLSYQLFDLLGKLLRTGNITGRYTQVNLRDFSPSTYLVTISNDNQKKLQTFKIIKN